MSSTTEYIILDKLGAPIKVLARNSLKAKNIAIRINNHKAELVIPIGKHNKAQQFLLNKEKWIRHKLSIMPKITIPSNKIKMLGREYNIIQKKSIRKWLTIDENALIIESPLGNYDEILVHFLQNRLVREIEQIIVEISKISNLKPLNIKVMNNKHRWGSCSSKGILSFHWRLIFTPYKILRYIVIHELCHLKEMNHSVRFWNLVEKLDPEYEKHKKWLKQNSAIIHAYLPNITFKRVS